MRNFINIVESASLVERDDVYVHPVAKAPTDYLDVGHRPDITRSEVWFMRPDGSFHFHNAGNGGHDHYGDAMTVSGRIDHDKKAISVMLFGKMEHQRIFSSEKALAERVLRKFASRNPGYTVWNFATSPAKRLDQMVFEGAAPIPQTLYHVTFASRIPKIKREGIQPGKKRNWDRYFGGKYGDMGYVYVFTSEESAARWGLKMKYEFKRDISIIVLSGVEAPTEADPSGEQGMMLNGQGTWHRIQGGIPASCITAVIPVDQAMTRRIVDVTAGRAQSFSLTESLIEDDGDSISNFGDYWFEYGFDFETQEFILGFPQNGETACQQESRMWGKRLRQAGFAVSVMEGYYHDDHGANAEGHVWLNVGGKIFDPTASQFSDFPAMNADQFDGTESE